MPATSKRKPAALGPLTRAQVLARARSAIGRQTVYQLGAGGRDPNTAHPGDLVAGHLECDCTGMGAWAFGVRRFVESWNPLYEGGDWFESRTLERDARSPWGFIAEVPWLQARPGDVLVWGDRPGSQGHFGIVATVDVRGPLSVIHCSSGNFRGTGDAIQETPPDLFRKKAALAGVIAWVIT